MSKKILVVVEGSKGGSGSGNFGHRGRSGKVGGSVGKGAGAGGMSSDNSDIKLVNLSVKRLAPQSDAYQNTIVNSINQINDKAQELGMSAQNDVAEFSERRRVYFTTDKPTAQQFSDFVNTQTTHKTTSTNPIKRTDPRGRIDYEVGVRIDTNKTKTKTAAAAATKSQSNTLQMTYDKLSGKIPGAPDTSKISRKIEALRVKHHQAATQAERDAIATQMTKLSQQSAKIMKDFYDKVGQPDSSG